jgi:hypothetical protein
MLWYKAWLETRWRFVFLIGSMVFMLFLGPILGSPPAKFSPALRLASSLLYCVAACFFAGAGINTQTFYAATSGFHGSMLFTLSLPVSRRRLFYARAGLGAIEMCIFVVVMAGFTILRTPEAWSALRIFAYVPRAIVCTLAIYTLSALLACVLDEVWQFTGTFLCLGMFFVLQRYALVRKFSPLRGMWLYTGPTPSPWAPVATSVALIGILVWASVLILQRKEY